MPDDAALTRLALAARRGDRTAATELVRHTYQQVWRVLVVLSNRRVAEDLTQETYARAFRSLPGFRAESSVRAWLLAIGRRVAADHIRTTRGRPKTDPHVPADETELAAPGDLSESVALYSLLDALEPDRRLAFVLTQLIGLSYAETAHVCGCPIGTVRSRVARARDDLAASVGPDSARAGTARAGAAWAGTAPGSPADPRPCHDLPG